MIRDATSRETHSDRYGLTVVELLAATVLSVLLMTAVLGVLQTITIGQKSLVRGRTQDAWHGRFTEQLAWDLTNSRTIRPLETGFQLDGFAGRDFGSGLPIHCRTIVQYSLQSAGDRACLLRTEIHPQSLALDNHSTDMVAFDIDGVAIVSPGDAPSSTIDGQPVLHQTTIDGDLPPRVRLELYHESLTVPLFAYDYALR